MPLSRRDFLVALLGAAFACSDAFALTVKGIEYLPISKIAQLCGMRYRTNIAGKSQSIFSKTSRMTFGVNSRAMDLNGITVWLGHPVVAQKRMLYIAKRDYFKSVIPILFPQNNGTPRKLLDVSKATALGWTYKTELADGIRLAYEDFLHNPMRAER